MVAGLYRDIKRQIVRCSLDSVEEIADEVIDLVNMSQLISPLQLSGNTSLDSFTMKETTTCQLVGGRHRRTPLLLLSTTTTSHLVLDGYC